MIKESVVFFEIIQSNANGTEQIIVKTLETLLKAKIKVDELNRTQEDNKEFYQDNIGIRHYITGFRQEEDFSISYEIRKVSTIVEFKEVFKND